MVSHKTKNPFLKQDTQVIKTESDKFNYRHFAV
jgi:hypothetical protein